MITEEQIQAVRTLCTEALKVMMGKVSYVNISYNHISTILNLVKEHESIVIAALTLHEEQDELKRQIDIMRGG
jgi:hypothetical protein